jgi:hypothetical protein
MQLRAPAAHAGASKPGRYCTASDPAGCKCDLQRAADWAARGTRSPRPPAVREKSRHTGAVVRRGQPWRPGQRNGIFVRSRATNRTEPVATPAAAAGRRLVPG